MGIFDFVAQLSAIAKYHDGPTEALRWVNYVLMHGADHLSMKHAFFDMPWYSRRRLLFISL